MNSAKGRPWPPCLPQIVPCPFRLRRLGASDATIATSSTHIKSEDIRCKRSCLYRCQGYDQRHTIMSAVVLVPAAQPVEYAGNTYEACALGQLPAESAKVARRRRHRRAPRDRVRRGRSARRPHRPQRVCPVRRRPLDATVFWRRSIITASATFETAGPLHYISPALGLQLHHRHQARRRARR